MGGVANTTKKAFTDTTNQFKTLVTHPSKLNLGQTWNMSLGGGLSPLTQAYHSMSPDAPGPKPDVSFNFDPNQSAADQSAINAEGQNQYEQTLAGIHESGTAETQRAKDLFGQMLPDIAENSQAAHLYDSTGYGQEVGRQQANIASQVAENEANQKNAALGARQGFQTGALQRGMGLEDFINQANVAKAIGAQMAPNAPSSKATGTSGALTGAGAGFQAGGPYGALAGAAGGYYLGSRANQKGGK